MGEERELSADFTAEGLTGRTLRLHPDWSIPTRRVRLGVKRAFELFPSGLLTRVKKERREAWDKRQGEALDGLQRELEAFDAAHPSPAGEEKAKRDDIASKLAQLRSLMSSYDDPGAHGNACRAPIVPRAPRAPRAPCAPCALPRALSPISWLCTAQAPCTTAWRSTTGIAGGLWWTPRSRATCAR